MPDRPLTHSARPFALALPLMPAVGWGCHSHQVLARWQLAMPGTTGTTGASQLPPPCHRSLQAPAPLPS